MAIRKKATKKEREEGEVEEEEEEEGDVVLTCELMYHHSVLAEA
jgi:hypothetical protein